MRVAFGEFVFDDEIRELRRGPERLTLSYRALVLLSALAHARPRALSRAELVEMLWPDGDGAESSLAGVVSELRGLLGETSRSTRFIKTVRAYGYAFGDGAEDPRGGRATKRTGGARLTWASGRVDIGVGAHVLGRGPDADVQVDSGTVSRRHARLTLGAGAPVVVDLGSTNGTWVNDARIDGPVELADGDSFRVGSVKIRLKLRPATTSRRPGRA